MTVNLHAKLSLKKITVLIEKKMKFKYSIVMAVLVLTVSAIELPAQTVDATTMTNKVMTGYQGWFRTPGDFRGNTGWAHWFNSSTLAPRALAFDTWPDMSELDADEKYAVPGYTNPDGSQAFLYSAQHPKTVLRHFKWMEQHNIDGVWLSQFCSHMPGGGSQSDAPNMLNIMNNVQKAATATGRTWAFMYDFSGLSPENVYSIIINQWKKMVNEGTTSDPRYMHHNGKPVLLLWGFFPNRKQSDPAYFKPIIEFLQAPGKYQATLVGGGDPNWQAKGTPEFQEMLMSMSAWQPWSVGRTGKTTESGYKTPSTSLWKDDMERCKANHVLFIPVINAGTHKAGPPPMPPELPIVPRRNGNYLWEQFAAASKLGGINSVFVAMFDEVNEGTQIMKVTNTPPTQAPFIQNEGATSDWYLRLTGLGGSMLKSHKPITDIIPISPFDSNKWYKIKNLATGLFLKNQLSKTNTSKAILDEDQKNDADLEWQLTYDGQYFILKNRSSAKLLTNGGITDEHALLTLTGDQKTNFAKWQLEWDGSGYCRIRTVKGNKAINGQGAAKSEVIQQTDSGLNDLRWEIIPQ